MSIPLYPHKLSTSVAAFRLHGAPVPLLKFWLICKGCVWDCEKCPSWDTIGMRDLIFLPCIGYMGDGPIVQTLQPLYGVPPENCTAELPWSTFQRNQIPAASPTRCHLGLKMQILWRSVLNYIKSKQKIISPADWDSNEMESINSSWGIFIILPCFKQGKLVSNKANKLVSNKAIQ